MKNELLIFYYVMGMAFTASGLSVKRDGWSSHKVFTAWLLMVALAPAEG